METRGIFKPVMSHLLNAIYGFHELIVISNDFITNLEKLKIYITNITGVWRTTRVTEIVMTQFFHDKLIVQFKKRN